MFIMNLLRVAYFFKLILDLSFHVNNVNCYTSFYNLSTYLLSIFFQILTNDYKIFIALKRVLQQQSHFRKGNVIVCRCHFSFSCPKSTTTTTDHKTGESERSPARDVHSRSTEEPGEGRHEKQGDSCLQQELMLCIQHHWWLAWLVSK